MSFDATLSVIWILPLAGALIIGRMPPLLAKWSGVVVALAALAVAVFVGFNFSPGYHGFQFGEKLAWIPQLSIFYRLGVDGISVWLVLLNAFLTVIAILATPVAKRTSGFVALMLAMSAGLAGLFMATDLVLFYVFWEAMLIPAYFLLWLHGEGPRPGSAAIKFVLYTLAGSLLMLVGVIGEYIATGKQTFDLATLSTLAPSPAIQFGLFFVFALAFAIKTPLFPFHSWLPDAYMAAPTPMLITFAGVMGKAGAYGFLRIAIPLFPQPVDWWDWRWVIPVLAVAAIIWGALMAIAQRDIKLLVSYSSVSHMGFIVLGVFALNVQGQQGAVIQMVNHGVIIAALFLLVGWLADLTGTRDRTAMAGLARRMPIMTGVFMVVTLAALGLPGLNSFVGEFMTLLGAWQRAPVLAVVAAIGLVLAPVYMLRLFQGAMHGEPVGPVPRSDLYAGRLTLLSPLVLSMFAIGLYPAVLTGLMTSVGQSGLYRP
ncbi:MAG TPA: NADH-quinone oxidoreductase subunit M [Candidatus Dormibacteraeota bacterium]|nr:NADH-quinone oxidoreductase subunit M [Candidatus Dormibacteraeota bacterium]